MGINDDLPLGVDDQSKDPEAPTKLDKLIIIDEGLNIIPKRPSRFEGLRPLGFNPDQAEDPDLIELNLTGLERIIGQPNLVAYLKRLTDLLKIDPRTLSRYNLSLPALVLLHGPPGTGKTQSIKYFAEEHSLPLMVIKASDVIEALVGQSAKNFREKVEELLKEADGKPAILVMDEVDAFIPNLSEGLSSTTNTLELRNEILQVISGEVKGNVGLPSNKKTGPLIVFGITNNLDKLDQAFASRANELILVGKPNLKDIKRLILNFELRGSARVLHRDETGKILIDLDKISQLLHGASGRDIDEMFKSLMNSKLEDIAGGYFPEITQKDLEEYISRNKQKWEAKKQFLKPITEVIPFDSIIGQEPAKKAISRLQRIISNKKKAASLGLQTPRSIIFHGPPGTGKTMLAQAFSRMTKCDFLYATASDIFTGNSSLDSKNVNRLFAEAKDSAIRHGHAIIFIDEIDAVMPNNGFGTGLRSEMLQALSGFAQEENVTLISATNFIDSLDLAFRDRSELIEFTELTPLQKFELFISALKKELPNIQIRSEDYYDLTDYLSSFSARGLVSFIKKYATELKLEALEFEQDGLGIIIDKEKLIEALSVNNRTNSDLTGDMRDGYNNKLIGFVSPNKKGK